MAESPRRESLVRAIFPGLELREEAGQTKPVLRGHFSVFDQWTTIKSAWERGGEFLEKVSPGAFTKTFSENRSRMRVLLEHGKDPTLGSKPIGTIDELREDEIGAYYEVSLFDGIPPLVMDGLRAGAYGASFRFSVMNEDYVERPSRTSWNERGIPTRVIKEARVAEFGPVCFGAYDGATAGIRSMTDHFLFDALTEDPDHLRELIEAKKSRTITSSAPTTRVVFTSRTSEPEVTREDTPSRLYERSVEFIGESIWAVHPGTLATIVQVIRERRAGITVDAEEIKARIKASPISDLVDDDSEDVETPDPAAAVAVLQLYGAIVPHATMFSDVSGAASVEEFTKAFRAAVADESKQAILIDINSPGGAVELVPELAAEILSARGSKPIVAQVNAFAASAAYWIATSADEIVVTPSGQVGSIGVYIAHDDLSAAQEKLGIKTTLVSAGKYKTEGNPFEPLTDEAEAELQAKVDAYYQMFIQAVAAGRDVKPSAVTSGFGEGRMVLAADAVEAGMADKVATYDDTLARLTKAAAATRSSEPGSSETTTPQGQKPEPSAATTSSEPERSVATTRAENGKPAGLYIPKRKDRKQWQL